MNDTCYKICLRIVDKIKRWEDVVIFYEAVWALGTGCTPKPHEIQAVHKDIRKFVKRNYGRKASETVRIIYGGMIIREV